MAAADAVTRRTCMDRPLIIRFLGGCAIHLCLVTAFGGSAAELIIVAVVLGSAALVTKNPDASAMAGGHRLSIGLDRCWYHV